MLDSLTRTETITWRRPAPASALPLLELADLQIVELVAAKNTAEPDDEAIKAMERELRDTISQIPNAEEIRITVRGATITDQARWRSLTVQGNAYYRSVVGEDPADESESDVDDAEAQERTSLMVALYQWSINVASLAKIEERAIPYVTMPGEAEPGEEDGWKETVIPAWIEDPEQYLAKIPLMLHRDWHVAAQDINPGVWAGGSFLAQRHGLREKRQRRRMH